MDLLELLAHGDVVERIAALTHVLRGQQSWQFTVLRGADWAGIEAERLLKLYGIPVWDRDFSDDFLFFRVPRQQANWAEYLLLRRGIPLVGAMFNPRNQVTTRQHSVGSMPRPWKQG